MTAPTARSLAAEVLLRVSKEKAYAAAVLDAKLGSVQALEARDRALATELVYGALRTAAYLDERLSRYAPRGLGKIDAATLWNLRIAAYQILFLDRVPAFAAVTEAVSLVRSTRSAKLGGFVNALLRRLADEAKHGPPARLSDALFAAAPAWLQAGLDRALGEGGAREFLAARVAAPPLGLRITAAEDRETWRARLAEAAPHATVDLGTVAPSALLLRGAGDPRKLPGYDEGAWTIQEEGAQLVALSLGTHPGERVLDACAGRGNKTALLAEAVAPGGQVDAADLHPQKLERSKSELARLHVSAHATYAVDWSVGPGGVPEGYDRVLVDAPCSGVGTISRRPEIALFRTVDDVGALAASQTRIVLEAATRLRPGGALVYAVCSVLREEGEDVVERVLAAAPALLAAPFPDGPARRFAGPDDRTSFRLLPHRDGTDGYFLASFVRRN